MPMPIDYQTAEHLTADQAAQAIRRYAIACDHPGDLAATELVIRHDTWLRKPPFRRAVEIYEDDEMYDNGGLMFGRIHWDLIPAALRHDDVLPGLRGSTSEVKILRIAVLIATGDTSCDGSGLFTGLGHHNIALVMRAIGAANGNRWNAQVWVGKPPPQARTDTPDIWDVPDRVDHYAQTFDDQLWPGGPQS